MDYFFLIFAIVIVIFMIMLYYYFSSNRTVLYGNQVQLSSANNTLKLSAITDQPGTLNYTLSLWVYVISWTADNKYNTIMNINTAATGSTANSTSQYTTITPTPAIPVVSQNYVLYLDQTKPNLYLYVPSVSPTAVSGDLLITNNFPVQSWVFISMSMQGTRADFYINGKLIGSQKMCPDGTNICAPLDTIELGVPIANGNGVTTAAAANATASPNMYIANVQRISTTSTPQQVWTSYLAGNGVSSTNLSSYGFDFGLTQNGQVVSQFKM